VKGKELKEFYSLLALGDRSVLDSVKLNLPNKRPYLLITEKELPAFRNKISRDPSKRIYGHAKSLLARTVGYEDRSRELFSVELLILLALKNGDRSSMEAAGKAFIESLRRSRPIGEIIMKGEVGLHHQPRPGATGPRYDFSVMRYVHRMMYQYDFIDSFGVLTEEEQKEYLDHTFWVLDRFMSPELRKLNSRYADRRHNFHSDNITVIGTVALCFPDHPRAREWLEYALTDFAWQMEHGVENEAWHETSRYHSAVLTSLIPLAYALRRNTNVDFFDNEGFRGLLDWLVRCQTPRDKVYGKWLLDRKATDMMAYPNEAVSLTPAIGDASWGNGEFAHLGIAAPAYKESDPAFAGRLMWGWHRAGCPYGSLLKGLILIDPSIKPVPQRLGSEGMLKAGYAILRSNYDRPDEKYLILACGHHRTKHWAKHRHRDQNSFSLFAEGVPLALDAGSGPYRTPEQILWYKATVSHNTVMFGGLDQDPEDGKILKFVSKEGVDYVLGDTGRASRAYQFFRHILFVKPDYFVIWDYIRSYVFAEWLLHSPVEEIRKSAHMLEFVTAWGVNLDVHFLLPEGPIEVWEGEGCSTVWPAERGSPPPHLRQRYVKVKNDAGKDFLTVLHPRKDGEERLTARLVGAEENMLEVRLGEQRDYVMLFPIKREYRDVERGIEMVGRIGLVRTGPKSSLTALIDGTRLKYLGN